MNLEKIMSSLNEEQREAAEDIDGSSMIIAGPGAGKTFVLVARTANMIVNGISAKNILLSTFTKKAAEEIKERVRNVIGAKANELNVGTYHSICAKILRKYADNVGLTKNFSIFDTDDCKKIIKDINKAINVNYEPSKILGVISEFKYNMKGPINAIREAKDQNQQKIAQIYQLYENMLLANNAVDFDNLVYKTIRLMQQFPDVKKEINNKYRYIVADESHDSSIMDLQLIRLLAGDNENICMILDNDQSIYAFRGARIDAVMGMKDYFSNMKIHTLNINYRSTQVIVNASRSIIANNTQFIEKNLSSNNEEGNPIIQFKERNSESEALRIVKLIKLSVEKYGYDYSDIAILYRMNYISKDIEEALLKYKIPYKLVGSINFYNRKEVKDIISYFSFLINPYDAVAFERILKAPKKGIGDTTIENIIKYSKDNKIDLMTALSSIEFKGKLKDKISNFIEILEELNDSICVEKPNESIERMIRLTNYDNYIMESEKAIEVAEEKIKNIEELIEISQYFDSIEELTANITLDSEIETEKENNNNCVNLLTMHSAKGLEWQVVILASVIEGSTPSYRANSFEEIEEERRLFYVGCTRAKKLLFITMPKYIMQKGNWIRTQQSRFIEEMDEQYLYKYGE